MPAKTALTRQLGELVANTASADIPARAYEIAVRGIADAVGTLIAGRSAAAVQALRRALPRAGDAHIVFSPDTASALDAARINGTAAHALDFDDVSVQGHPSAVLIAALLPEAEVLGASGQAFLDAYLLGFETWADLVLREPDQHHRKGWHPTGIFGTIGAAAACARLHCLDARQASHAIGIAASQSAGVMANFGSMVKPLHVGNAASAGALSARLAKAGMTASADVLEHAQGLLNAVSPAGRMDVETAVRNHADWHLLRHGLIIKKYPTCLSTHRGLDGMAQLMARTPFTSEQVRHITVRMSARNATILHAHRPHTALEGKFSIEFAMAGMLVAGRLSLLELVDEFVERGDVQALLHKVSVEHDTREDPVTGYAPEDVITVELDDGRRLSQAVSAMKGTPENPIDDADLGVKFESCLRAGAYAESSTVFFQQLLDMAHIENMSTFVTRWSRGAQARTPAHLPEHSHA